MLMVHEAVGSLIYSGFLRVIRKDIRVVKSIDPWAY